MQLLVRLSKHLIDFLLEPIIAIEHLRRKLFLILGVGVPQKVFKSRFEPSKRLALQAQSYKRNLRGFVRKAFDIVHKVSLHLDKPSSEVFLVTSVLRRYLHLSPDNGGVVAELSVLGFQLRNPGVGLSQELLDLRHRDRRIGGGTSGLSRSVVGG
jgi:hypothetical protein